MGRWILVALGLVAAALAGPFERVDNDDPVYRELRLLDSEGLFEAAWLTYNADGMTRYECANLWNVAYERLIGAMGAPVTSRNSDVEKVAAAMRRLLDAFEPELVRMEVDPAAARHQLGQLSTRLAALPRGGRSWREVASRQPGTAPVPASPPALGADRAVTVSDASFSLHARREAVNWSTDTFAESLGARLTAARVGPLETGVTVSQISLFEANAEGQQEFRKGHVLAADLRLRLGDQSVWLEYLSSMGEEVSRRLDEEAGRAFQATFVKQFGDHLKLDLGYRRLSAGFVPFDSLLTGLEAPDLYGVQAGVAYRSSRFDIRSSGSVYRPEGQPVGYANQFGATMGYRWTDRWRVTLGYQGVNRRRLANLDDMWRNSFTGGISYGSSARLRADLSYRYDTSDVEQEPAGHTIGASLGLGF